MTRDASTTVCDHWTCNGCRLIFRGAVAEATRESYPTGINNLGGVTYGYGPWQHYCYPCVDKQQASDISFCSDDITNPIAIARNEAIIMASKAVDIAKAAENEASQRYEEAYAATWRARRVFNEAVQADREAQWPL